MDLFVVLLVLLPCEMAVSLVATSDMGGIWFRIHGPSACNCVVSIQFFYTKVYPATVTPKNNVSKFKVVCNLQRKIKVIRCTLTNARQPVLLRLRYVLLTVVTMLLPTTTLHTVQRTSEHTLFASQIISSQRSMFKNKFYKIVGQTQSREPYIIWSRYKLCVKPLNRKTSKSL